MAEGPRTVKRVLLVKFRALGDPKQMAAMVRGAAPFYGALGAARFRCLQNVDEPAQFLVEIEYEADAALELNRQNVASDPMIRTIVQGWRQWLAGSAEMDVYEDVTG